ncbi:Na/Pi cotransporter family protein [bacterium]|nr:Na/Pi cotransporter family protein [bacterium]
MNNFLSLIEIGDTKTFTIISVILGGLGIFLYGLNLMSSSLNSLAGSKLKEIVTKATDNIFKGFLIGFIITIIVQSSSATTVIVVGLISAGLLDLKHALPIMIGAHIGTTALAYIISLNVISTICLPLIFVGAFIIMLINGRKWKLSGRIITGIGFLFFGLELMSISFGSFAETDWFNNIMTTLGDNLFLSFLTGMVLTAIIQSSGAFIGIVQELYITTSSMTLASAIALVIGSNIGTTITAFLASLGANKTAKKAAIANTFVILIGVIIFLPLTVPVSKLFILIENSVFVSRNKFTLAFFHTFFNVIGSAVALLLLRYIILLINKLIKEEERKVLLAEKLNKELLKSPSLALEAARHAIIEMNSIIIKMYDTSIHYFNENNEKYFEEINNEEENVDLCEHLIHDYIMQISEIHLNRKDAFLQTQYIDAIRDFERIADHAVNFSEYLKRYYEEKNMMSDEMHEALLKFFNICRSQVQDSIIAFEHNDIILADKVIKREETVNKMEKEYRLNVHSYLKVGEVSQLDILYIDLVSNLERISDHTTNICQMIIDPHMMSTLVTGTK